MLVVASAALDGRVNMTTADGRPMRNEAAVADENVEMIPTEMTSERVIRDAPTIAGETATAVEMITERTTTQLSTKIIGVIRIVGVADAMIIVVGEMVVEPPDVTMTAEVAIA